MRERDLRRLLREHAERQRERLGILRRERRLDLRRERRRAEPEVAVALRREPLAEPLRGLLGAPVLGEPPRELLGGLLRIELCELGLLVREERARLQLEQRRDEDEELAARLEVELLPLGQPLEEGDDDAREVDVPQVELLLEDEREQQVERPLERVEVELELPDDHARSVVPLPDAALRDSHARAGLDRPRLLHGLRRTARGRTATRRRSRPSRIQTTSETQKLIRMCEEVVGRVDPQDLLERAEGRVPRDVEREERRPLDREAPVDPEQDADADQVPDELVEEGRLVVAVLPGRAGTGRGSPCWCAWSMRSPHGRLVGLP